MQTTIQIDEALWQRTRAGARAGRGFRYQDAAAMLLAVRVWANETEWTAVVPEGVDDVTLHGSGKEVRVQIKSRHDPRAIFTQAEIIGYLAKTIAAERSQTTGIHFGLLLERSVQGLLPSGWQTGVLASAESPSEFVRALSQALAEPDISLVEGWCDRSHLIIEPDPIEAAVAILENRLSIPSTVARIIAHSLRLRCGACADSNYSASADRACTISISDTQAIIDSVLRVVDANAVAEATRAGICELVTFNTKSTPADFYSGVNVTPAHVSAGLVFERPEETAAILDALTRKRAALVAGPSGAGKSALTWLSAYLTRHEVRWYRVLRADPSDIPTLVRHARILEASTDRPVGFIFDDTGRDSMSGWDRLITDTEGEPGILALGSIREEDVFTLSTASQLPVIRPLLTEGFAQRLWAALSEEGQAAVPHWREPYVLCQGLLLEYTHILTQGERLSQTVRGQVHRRIAEQRDNELAVLGAVSFAAAHGGSVEIARLRLNLGLSQAELARAVARLINEHAIREHADGRLSGLHELRSENMDIALREAMLSDLGDSLQHAVAVLRPTDFSVFIPRVLRRWPNMKLPLFKALSTRMAEEQSVGWVSILHGLGLSSLDVAATRWIEITRRVSIEDTNATFAYSLAIAKADVKGFPNFERVASAISEFYEQPAEDFRREFYETYPTCFNSVVLRFEEALEFIACLLPMPCGDDDLSIPWTLDDTSKLPTIPYLDFVRTVLEVDPARARHFVERAGGEDQLLADLYQSMPWISKPRRINFDNAEAISANILVVSNEVQPDVNADVVRLCELMLAAAPDAELAVSDAVGPDGEPIAFAGIPVASKRIRRNALPTSATVAWNRAALRAVQRVVGAPSATPRANAYAAAIHELAQRLAEAAEMYCRMEQPNAKWRALVQVRGLLNTLVQPPPLRGATPGPLHRGEYETSDVTETFVSSLQELVQGLVEPRIDKPLFLALKAVDLANKIEAVSGSALWRWLDEVPDADLKKCHGILRDLRDVLGYAATTPRESDGTRLRISRSSRRYPALARAAEEARRHAQQIDADKRRFIESQFLHHSFKAHVCSRTMSKDDGYFWPAIEYAVLIEVEELLNFLQLGPLFESVRESVPEIAALSFAPLLHGFVAPAAIKIIHAVFPCEEFGTEWGSHLPFPVVAGGLAERFNVAVSAIGSISTIASIRDRPHHEAELSFLGVLQHRLADELEAFRVIAEVNADDPIVIESAQFLLDACRRLQDELAFPQAEISSVGAELIQLLSQRGSEFTAKLILYRLLLIERDIEGRAKASV